MRRVLSLFVIPLLAFTLATAGCGRKGPRLPPTDPGAVVLAFGDSLTFGTGAGPEESYPSVLERLISRKVVRSGVPGETTAEGLARLPDVLADTNPQLVILCLGGNDLLRRTEESKVKDSLRKLVQLAQGKGITVVLMAPPRPALLTDAPPLYAELAGELKVPLENTVLTKVLTDNSLKSDPIHPNAKGYAKIAEALAKLLKDAGAV